MLGYLLLVILVASGLGYLFNLYAARRLTAGGQRLHSLAGFHGAYAICLTGLPAFVFVLLWLLFQNTVIETIVAANLPADALAGLDEGKKSLLMAEIRSVAAGNIFGEPAPHVLAARRACSACAPPPGWRWPSALSPSWRSDCAWPAAGSRPSSGHGRRSSG